MKKISVFLFLPLLLSCIGKEKSMLSKTTSSSEQIAYTIASAFSFEPENLYAEHITKTATIKTKTFAKNEGDLRINYTYPSLDETINPLWRSFNSYIHNQYVNQEDALEKILENEALSCDPLYDDAKRTKRSLDYKVYTNKSNFLSILLYKTNYYDNKHHNSQMFKGLNYDLKRGAFITYTDLFEEGSERLLLFKLNQELDAWKVGEDSYNDCWKLTEDTFKTIKDNFVLTDNYIRFYFDDCVVCPPYTGNHFFEIPREELTQMMKYQENSVLEEILN